MNIMICEESGEAFFEYLFDSKGNSDKLFWYGFFLGWECI